MKLMVQCPQVNHHLLLPLREFMTFVSDAIIFCLECIYIIMYVDNR